MPVDGELPAVRVSVEDAVPPAGTVTGVGRVTITPLGDSPLHVADRLIVELNPFTDEKVRVVVLAMLGLSVIAAGAGEVMKSGPGDETTTVPEGVTINCSVAECAIPPLVAVTVNG